MTDLPAIGAPATRALSAEGIADLESVAAVAPQHLLTLHGVGPRAIRILREALAGQGIDW